MAPPRRGHSSFELCIVLYIQSLSPMIYYLCSQGSEENQVDSDLNTLGPDVWEFEDEFLDDVFSHSHGIEADDMAYWEAEYAKQVAANS